MKKKLKKDCSSISKVMNDIWADFKLKESSKFIKVYPYLLRGLKYKTKIKIL